MSTHQPLKKIAAISIFPDMFKAISEFGVVGKAFSKNLLSLDIYNPRDFVLDKHRRVDDRPYGGGAGMLMMPEPLKAALTASRSKHPNAKVIYLSPQGRRLDQAYLKSLGTSDDLIFLCGRYEGVDERFIERYVDEECSLGDYVISGGELACMVLIDALARLVPGVCGEYDSVKQDSFYSGVLDYPNYTRPEVFEDQSVPKVLLGGNHAEINAWREKQAFERTRQRRPDLIEEKLNQVGFDEYSKSK